MLVNLFAILRMLVLVILRIAIFNRKSSSFSRPKTHLPQLPVRFSPNKIGSQKVAITLKPFLLILHTKISNVSSAPCVI